MTIDGRRSKRRSERVWKGTLSKAKTARSGLAHHRQNQSGRWSRPESHPRDHLLGPRGDQLRGTLGAHLGEPLIDLIWR